MLGDVAARPVLHGETVTRAVSLVQPSPRRLRTSSCSLASSSAAAPVRLLDAPCANFSVAPAVTLPKTTVQSSEARRIRVEAPSSGARGDSRTTRGQIRPAITAPPTMNRPIRIPRTVWSRYTNERYVENAIPVRNPVAPRTGTKNEKISDGSANWNKTRQVEDSQNRCPPGNPRHGPGHSIAHGPANTPQ